MDFHELVRRYSRNPKRIREKRIQERKPNVLPGSDPLEGKEKLSASQMEKLVEGSYWDLAFSHEDDRWELSTNRFAGEPSRVRAFPELEPGQEEELDRQVGRRGSRMWGRPQGMDKTTVFFGPEEYQSFQLLELRYRVLSADGDREYTVTWEVQGHGWKRRERWDRH